MSFALTGVLQAAVFAALQADTTLASIVGDAIYDAVPTGALPAIYVRLGSEEAVDASDVSGDGAFHTFRILVITSDPGFAQAKAAAAAISDILHGGDLVLSRGRLVSTQFQRATAGRVDGLATRQIEMRFRARVQDG